jgi:hypothetical protein
VFWWGKLRERNQLEDPGHRQDSIKMDLQEVGCEGMASIDLAQDMDR